MAGRLLTLASTSLGGSALALGIGLALSTGAAHADTSTAPSGSSDASSTESYSRATFSKQDRNDAGKKTEDDDPGESDAPKPDSRAADDDQSEDPGSRAQGDSPSSRHDDAPDVESDDKRPDSATGAGAADENEADVRSPGTGRSQTVEHHRDDSPAADVLANGGNAAPADDALKVSPALVESVRVQKFQHDSAAPAPIATISARQLTSLTPQQAVEALMAWARQQLRSAATGLWQDSGLSSVVALLKQRVDEPWHGFPAGQQTPEEQSPAPSPQDVVQTPFGEIGKWMLAPTTGAHGKVAWHISDWLGQVYGGRNLLEPINVVVVDRTSVTAAESQQRLVATLAGAGFPARVVHSSGYEGLVDGVQYAQQPGGTNEAFSNCFYLFPNDHARFFGPAPAADGNGFVWTAALSRERVGIYDWSFTHRYVSFTRARNTMHDNLIRNGATDLGLVDLQNSLSNATQFTGDHDGYAAVVELR